MPVCPGVAPSWVAPAGILIGAMGEALASMNVAGRRYQEEVQQVTEYLRVNHVPAETRDKVQEHRGRAETSVEDNPRRRRGVAATRPCPGTTSINFPRASSLRARSSIRCRDRRGGGHARHRGRFARSPRRGRRSPALKAQVLLAKFQQLGIDRTFPFIADAPRGFQLEIVAHLRDVFAFADETVFAEETSGACMFLVVSGRAVTNHRVCPDPVLLHLEGNTKFGYRPGLGLRGDNDALRGQLRRPLRHRRGRGGNQTFVVPDEMLVAAAASPHGISTRLVGIAQVAAIGEGCFFGEVACLMDCKRTAV